MNMNFDQPPKIEKDKVNDVEINKTSNQVEILDTENNQTKTRENNEQIEKIKKDLLAQFEEKEGGNKIKEGIDFIFEQNPELAQIGTEKQYSEYLDTIFPGSKIKDVVYHGTNENFESFDENIKGKRQEHGGFFVSGYYFALHKLHAALFAFNDKEESKKDGYGKIFPIMLDVKNPYYYSKEKDFEKSFKNEKEFTQELIDQGYDSAFLFKNNNLEDAKRLYSEATDGLSEEYIKSFIEKQLTLNEIPKQGREDFVNGRSQLISDFDGNAEIAVFNPTQIHVLGSKQDIENFKNFLSKKE